MDFVAEGFHIIYIYFFSSGLLPILLLVGCSHDSLAFVFSPYFKDTFEFCNDGTTKLRGC